MGTTSDRLTLRELPLPARLLLSAFLISVGVGYFSALVQLHFQHASSGDPLPKADDVVDIYGKGRPGVTELERLLTADERRPFASGGTMKPAFFAKSAGWVNQIRKRGKEIMKEKKTEKAAAERLAETELRRERELEVAAVLAWVRAGAKEESYPAFPISADLIKKNFGEREPNADFFTKDDKDQWTANVSQIVDVRCVRCHSPGNGAAGQIDLSSWDNVATYCEPGRGSGVSLTKLAQTTHVHLLGFSMLYGMTGLIFAFTSFPGAIRAVVAPLPLLAQVIDIACWWLARLDALYARAIIYTGGVVACGLALHIVLSLLNMYRATGKIVVLLLLAAGGVGAWQLHQHVIEPFLAAERAASVAR